MIMTFAELETSLLAMLVAQPNYSSRIFDYFTNLYNLGVRPTELYHINQWQRGAGSEIILHPSKNNYDRFFDVAQLTPLLVDAIDNGVHPYYGILYGKGLYFFEKWYVYEPVFVGAKSIDLYLFRHHYVKKIYNDGMTVAEVTLHMGWVNPTMADNYINSVIEYF